MGTVLLGGKTRAELRARTATDMDARAAADHSSRVHVVRIPDPAPAPGVASDVAPGPSGEALTATA